METEAGKHEAGHGWWMRFGWAAQKEKFLLSSNLHLCLSTGKRCHVASCELLCFPV